MKKIISLILTMLMVLSLAACGKKPVYVPYIPQQGTNVTPTAGSEMPTEETLPQQSAVEEGPITLTIGLPTNAKVTSFENNALTQWIEETCDVELEFVEYAGGSDVAVQISTAVAARQELPNILYGISLNAGAISSYGEDGYFVDLTPYYEDKDGASRVFWSRLNESLDEDQQDYIIRSITDPDTGKIYGVPTVETSTIDKRKYQPWINQVWLDQLGLKMPTNTQELYDVLVAFKTRDPAGNGNTIPLYGSEKSGGSAGVVDWIINMFIYYNPDNCWQDYNGDGQLEYVYTQDAYREALKFLNRLYNDGLLSSMIYTASGSDLKSVITPASGQAMCGVFCGHLNIHTTIGNELLYDYVPVPIWGYAVEGDISCPMKTFITESCDEAYRAKAFEVLMTLWSWEGSMRVRYGAFGANWTYADYGAVSSMNHAATFKLIQDPLIQQNNAHWGTIASCFIEFAEGETAQLSENISQWAMTRDQMFAQSRQYFEEAIPNNPSNLCPKLVFTTAEAESTEMIRTNIKSLVFKKEMAYITGIGADINSDADWNAYQQELLALGLNEYRNVVYAAYERS